MCVVARERADLDRTPVRPHATKSLVVDHDVVPVRAGDEYSLHGPSDSVEVVDERASLQPERTRTRPPSTVQAAGRRIAAQLDTNRELCPGEIGAVVVG